MDIQFLMLYQIAKVRKVLEAEVNLWILNVGLWES